MNKNTEKLAQLIAENISEEDLSSSLCNAKIAAEITRCRISRNMTQKEFATLLGVTQSMVSKWESEEYNFSIDTLSRIARKLDLELVVKMQHQRHNETVFTSYKPKAGYTVAFYSGKKVGANG